MTDLSDRSDAKQNTKKELKETLNWTSSAENRGTGRTDAQASVHPMIVGSSDALASAQVCAPNEDR